MPMRLLIQGEEGQDHSAFLGADTNLNVLLLDRDGNPVSLATPRFAFLQVFSGADRSTSKMRDLPVVPVVGKESSGFGTIQLADDERILVSRAQLYVWGFWSDPSTNADAGKVLSAKILTTGSNYSKAPIVTVDETDTGGTGLALTTKIKGVCSATFTVSNAGSGYTTAAVSFNTPAGGIAATGTVILNEGLIVGISLTYAGQGYTTDAPPVATITGDGADGAVTCSISGGVVYAVNISAPGSGYKLTPLLTLANASGDTTGSGATLSAIVTRGDVQISDTASTITLK